MQKGNCFLISVLCFVCDSLVHHRAEQAQHLFAFNSLFYFMQTEMFPGNGLGSKGSLKIIHLTCPGAPAAPFKPRHSVTVELLIFLQGCGRNHGAGMLLEHRGFTIPCPPVLLDSVSLAYLHQIRCSVLALGELQHDGETRTSKARNWNWQQRFDFCSHFISPSQGDGEAQAVLLCSIWGCERGLKVCGPAKGDNVNSE